MENVRKKGKKRKKRNLEVHNGVIPHYPLEFKSMPSFENESNKDENMA